MKKLVCAAVVAGSMFAMADEVKTEAAPAAPTAAEALNALPKRKQMTPEEREALKAKKEKFLAERKAEMQAKLLPVVQKYVPDEEKAKALLNDLEAAMKEARRPPRRPMPPKKAEAKCTDGKCTDAACTKAEK